MGNILIYTVWSVKRPYICTLQCILSVNHEKRFDEVSIFFGKCDEKMWSGQIWSLETRSPCVCQGWEREITTRLEQRTAADSRADHAKRRALAQEQLPRNPATMFGRVWRPETHRA